MKVRLNLLVAPNCITTMLLESREVDLDFTVLTVYKGSVRPGAVVMIRSRNDMLVYPGEAVSRYEKRTQLLEERATELRAAAEERAAVQEALDRGDITTAEAEQRFSQRDARDDELIGETAELRRIRRQPII